MGDSCDTSFLDASYTCKHSWAPVPWMQVAGVALAALQGTLPTSQSVLMALLADDSPWSGQRPLQRQLLRPREGGPRLDQKTQNTTYSRSFPTGLLSGALIA